MDSSGGGMKFGKLADITGVDWTLPPDDPLLKEVLNASEAGQAEVFFGAPAWGHPSWLGKIYPLGTPREKFLYYYSRYFNCIELNTTHYRIPTQEQIHKWVSQVPKGFLFCPKIFQEISHTRKGLLHQELLQVWYSSIEKFGEHLGPCFLQLPPHFDYSFKAELFAFLQQWPDKFPLALEFRHPSWFDKGTILSPLVRYLKSRQIGIVITDVAGRRDVLHMSLGTDFTLLRFVGNELDATDFERAKVWTQKIMDWNQLGLKKIFLFIHEPDDISVPEMTDFFLQELSRQGKWIFPKPQNSKPQMGLFRE